MEDHPNEIRVTKDDLKNLPARDESGNKGVFGKTLGIAGSRKICGAAYLSAKAALLSGIGMVKIYTEEANRIPLATLFISPRSLFISCRYEFMLSKDP